MTTKIGMKPDPNAKPYKLKRSRLRKVSKKQAKRNRSLRAKKEVVLNAMHERWGTAFCVCAQSTANVAGVLCLGGLDWDHVLSRGSGGDDSFSNCQILCRNHHSWKHRTPGMYDRDFRSDEMKEFMRGLDVI